MSLRAWLLFASMCLIWGIPYLLIRVAVEDVSPAMLVLARTAIAAAILMPIAARRKELQPILGHWRPVLVFAAIEIAIPWILLGAAETELSSSLTALLIATVPLIGTVIAWGTGTLERLSVGRTGGLLIGLAGVASIVGLSIRDARFVPLVEVGLVALCYATGPVIVQRWLAELPSLGVIAISLGLTAVVFVPITAVSGAGDTPSATTIAAIGGLALICTALAFVLFFALIAEVGPVRATVITYVNPAVAAVLGIVILSEDFTVGMGAGFVLVLVGSVLATRPASTADRAGIDVAQAS